ncbi:hypothetical protein tinsulaeT_00560 [Thalassotalea insulae]|uniref:Uncharacterized protein n=1 Tax=Thalassotalea insulae TaxID=2056778 RepID=A0ABQ6GRD2_9GAMM|nr:hypothetical protein [Thalassotalea insulae]GLX76716.1 hypothetical protein tinsulaeT_00560 [Thalassotalea insulae]
MKLISILVLISITLFTLGYGYKINDYATAHENWEQPQVNALAALKSEDFLSIEKEALGTVITSLATNYDFLKQSSNSRIIELKELINILLLVLFINLVCLLIWVYSLFRRKTI